MYIDEICFSRKELFDVYHVFLTFHLYKTRIYIASYILMKCSQKAVCEASLYFFQIFGHVQIVQDLYYTYLYT